MQTEYYDRQLRELKRRAKYFDYEDNDPKTDAGALKTLFEYIKFLQDEVVTKLISSVLESRSTIIIDQKRFD